MTWPTTPVAVGELITAAQLNLLPIRIADTTVDASADATIDLTSIPGGFSHLKVYYDLRADLAGNTLDTPFVRFNGDSGNNYAYQYADFAVTVNSNNGFESQSKGRLGNIPAATATANRFGVGTIDIENYTSSHHKGATWQHADYYGAGGEEAWVGGFFWLSTATITQITFILPSGANFVTGSRVTLYGIP